MNICDRKTSTLDTIIEEPVYIGKLYSMSGYVTILYRIKCKENYQVINNFTTAYGESACRREIDIV